MGMYSYSCSYSCKMYSYSYSYSSITSVLVLVLVSRQCTRTRENVLGPRSGARVPTEIFLNIVPSTALVTRPQIFSIAIAVFYSSFSCVHFIIL